MYSLAFSSDGKYLLSGGDDTEIKIWDLSNGQLLNSVKNHNKTIYNLAFTDDGSILASGGLDGSIKVWETEVLLRKKTNSLFKMATECVGSYPVDNGNTTILDLKFSKGNLLYTSVLSNGSNR